MNLKILSLFLLFIFSQSSFGHGMNKLGPNGGFIQMPGAFHTELVEKTNQFQVYLLDMNFKNPLTKNSSVKIKFNPTGAAISCTPQGTYFVCEKPKSKQVNLKELILYPIRNKATGREAIYKWPLKTT